MDKISKVSDILLDIISGILVVAVALYFLGLPIAGLVWIWKIIIGMF